MAQDQNELPAGESTPAPEVIVEERDRWYTVVTMPEALDTLLVQAAKEAGMGKASFMRILLADKLGYELPVTVTGSRAAPRKHATKEDAAAYQKARIQLRRERDKLLLKAQMARLQNMPAHLIAEHDAKVTQWLKDHPDMGI